MQSATSKKRDISPQTDQNSFFSRCSLVGKWILKGENLVYLVGLCLASVLFASWYVDFVKAKSLSLEAMKPTKVEGVKASSVVTRERVLKGRVSAPYTLVEFGDYECPPCRAALAGVEDCIKSHTAVVRFDFRNLPLDNIHPHARLAANIAEAARNQGKFWDVHERLMKMEFASVDSPPDMNTADEIRKSVGLEPKQFNRDFKSSAVEAVDRDLKLATKLRVEHTPSFIICCPDGTILRFQSLSSVNRYLDNL